MPTYKIRQVVSGAHVSPYRSIEADHFEITANGDLVFCNKAGESIGAFASEDWRAIETVTP